MVIALTELLLMLLGSLQMSKEFIITQEELDTLEAIRLKLYDMFAECGNISDIIKIGEVSEPLWRIIHKKREEIMS